MGNASAMSPRALAGLCVLALAGCNAGGATGTREQARNAALAFVTDCARGRTTAAQDILTDAVRGPFLTAGTGLQACLRVLGVEPPANASPDQLRGLAAQVKVGAVTELRGEQFATVPVTGPSGSRRDLEIEQRGELWYIATGP